MHETVSTENAPEAIGPYSQAIIAGNTVYTAGQIGLTPEGEMVDGGIEAETRQALENLSAVLEAAGASLGNAVKVDVFIADLEDYGAMNEVYAGFFPEAAPARAAVEVAKLPRDARVELSVVAVLD